MEKNGIHVCENIECLVGYKFGKILVLDHVKKEDVPYKRKDRKWYLTKCECGELKIKDDCSVRKSKMCKKCTEKKMIDNLEKSRMRSIIMRRLNKL